MLAFFKKLLFALVLAALVLVGIQPENLQALSEKIQFHFKLWDFLQVYTTPQFPVSFLFVVFFLLGMLTAGFHGVYEKLARRLDIRKRDRRIRELERERDDLKARMAKLQPPPEPQPEPGEPAATGPEGQEAERPRLAAPAEAVQEEEPTL